MNPYRVLGVERTASEAEIKRAYFRKVKEFPPETHPEEFKLIRQAYEQLRTAAVRAQTELFSFHEPPGDFQFSPPPPAPPLALEPGLALLLSALKEQLPEWQQTDLSDDFTEVPL